MSAYLLPASCDSYGKTKMVEIIFHKVIWWKCRPAACPCGWMTAFRLAPTLPATIRSLAFPAEAR